MASPAPFEAHGRTLEDEIVPESDRSIDEEVLPRAMANARPRSRPRADLVHSSEWFQRAIADDLWIPEMTERVDKPSRPRRLKSRRVNRRKRKRRNRPKRGIYPKRLPQYPPPRVADSHRVVEPLLTSWFEIENFSDEVVMNPWRTSNMPPPANIVRDEDEEEQPSVNSVFKLRLFPTSDQKQKLDQMFASNRAVYNKLVAFSRNDRLEDYDW